MRTFSVGSYSVCGRFATVLQGEVGVSENQVIMNPTSGIETLNKDGLNPLLTDLLLNLTNRASTSIFADTWNNLVNEGISKSSKLKSILDTASISSDLESLNSLIADQLFQVSKVIASRSSEIFC